MAVASTTALTVAAIAATAGAGYGAYAGERTNSLQRQGRRRQEAAQKEAIRIQLIERQRAELAAANAAKPSPSAQLADPVEPATTDLTGGIERDRLRLMRSSRLGG